MPEGARGFLQECRPVLAITRDGAIWFRSVEEARAEYGIRTKAQLRRMIDSGQVAPDGYTTFEDPIEGVVYPGMRQVDIVKVQQYLKAQREHKGDDTFQA